MKKIFIVFLSCFLILTVFVLPVSAQDIAYFPYELFGDVDQAFVTASDGSISYQPVYRIGSYGYGILPVEYPISNFEMQFTFQIDSSVNNQSYIIFDMNFDRVTYNYPITAIRYNLFVAGGGSLKEETYYASTNSLRNDFSFVGYSLYSGSLAITVTFLYSNVGVSEEEYYFSDITYYNGTRQNAPVLNGEVEQDILDVESADQELRNKTEAGMAKWQEVFENSETRFAFSQNGMLFVSQLLEQCWDTMPWLSNLLWASMIIGMFGFLFNLGGAIFSFARSESRRNSYYKNKRKGD